MADGERLNIVDGEGQFSGQLSGFLERAGIPARKKDYNIIAIMGCQSSGKSTLLNLLFGTQFDMMDASRGRSQTTRGIWISRAKESYTMVMDLEGTDGRERGDSGVSFERKTALFALSVAEILMINLWFQDIGRRNASNYDLLKTVFEINLQLSMGKDLSSKEARTTLLFIVRDHVKEVTPLELLGKLLIQDLNDIWNNMEKPEFFKDKSMEEFFDIRVTSLSHKLLAAEAFNADVDSLRGRFYDKNREDYLLNTDERKRIPGDGLSMYTSQLWDAIKDNKDLDLPAQKELLSIYRCGEIMDEVLAHEAVTGPVEDTKAKTSRGELADKFGAVLQDVSSTAVKMFELKAVLYQSEKGFTTKREELLQKIKQMFAPIFDAQLEIARSAAFQSFVVTLTKLYKKAKADGTKVVRFQDSFKELSNKSMDSFMEVMTDAQCEMLSFVDEGDKAIRQFCKSLEEEGDKQRSMHLELFVKEMKHFFTNLLNKKVDSLIESAPADMWVQLRQVVGNVRKEAKAEVNSRLEAFGASDKTSDETREDISEHPTRIMKKKLQELSNPQVMVYKLRKRFDDHFKYDRHGIPRVWRPGVDVSKLFQEARDESLKLLRVFSVIRLEEEADKIPCPLDVKNSAELEPYKSQVVLGIDDIADLKDRFNRETEAAFHEAKAAQERNMLTQGLPPWVLALIAVLGFNEFMTILTNPLYLFLFVIVGGGGFFLYSTGMIDPALYIMKESANAAVSYGQARLAEMNSAERSPRPTRQAMPSQSHESSSSSANTVVESKKDQ